MGRAPAARRHNNSPHYPLLAPPLAAAAAGGKGGWAARAGVPGRHTWAAGPRWLWPGVVAAHQGPGWTSAQARHFRGLPRPPPHCHLWTGGPSPGRAGDDAGEMQSEGGGIPVARGRPRGPTLVRGGGPRTRETAGSDGRCQAAGGSGPWRRTPGSLAGGGRRLVRPPQPGSGLAKRRQPSKRIPPCYATGVGEDGPRPAKTSAPLQGVTSSGPARGRRREAGGGGKGSALGGQPGPSATPGARGSLPRSPPLPGQTGGSHETLRAGEGRGWKASCPRGLGDQAAGFPRGPPRGSCRFLHNRLSRETHGAEYQVPAGVRGRQGPSGCPSVLSEPQG